VAALVGLERLCKRWIFKWNLKLPVLREGLQLRSRQFQTAGAKTLTDLMPNACIKTGKAHWLIINGGLNHRITVINESVVASATIDNDTVCSKKTNRTYP